MSILGKKWVLNYKRKPDESLWSALLASRNIKDPGQFFSNPEISDLHDPFLFPDMQKSVDRIKKAIKARERIVIYGDYDVDGISGSAILIHTLRFLGAEVSYRIPHRMQDGYGLHKKYVEELIDQKVSLLITVDLGISCPDEIALAQKNNIDVILTDHHTVPTRLGRASLPKAFAILHPQSAKAYPFKYLSGSGVAFKLASALLIDSKNEELIPALTDLASLGTVADCVSLTGENRTIVKLGLAQMPNTKWDGLKAILKSANAWEDQNFDTYTIGFQIGPRINASGRMDNPYWALQTLLAESKEATQKSKKLEQLNLDRRLLTQKIQEEAESTIDPTQPILIAESTSWPSGLVGLIAGRLQEKHGKPAFILEDRGDSLVGSARSYPGFHTVEALQKAAHLLENFGGHEQAAGFHLKKSNYDEFKKILLSQKTPPKPQTQVDLELLPGEANLEHCERILSFAPFGEENQSPVFLLQNIKILDQRPVGSEEKHLKFSASFGDEILEGIAFNFAPHATALQKATSLLVALEKNHWNGLTKPQLKLIDFH
jgi:single-stranded-DNA-specific exonuclease